MVYRLNIMPYSQTEKNAMYLSFPSSNFNTVFNNTFCEFLICQYISLFSRFETLWKKHLHSKTLKLEFSKDKSLF